MTICLVIQKDTLENNKVKSILKIINEETPEEFVSNLQEGHCFHYQLVSHTGNNPVLFDRIIKLISSYKTDLGKDWYELDHDILAKVVSLFLEFDKVVIDFKTISSIFGFSLKLFPVVTKEIKITSKDSHKDHHKDIPKEEIITLVENLSEIPRKKKSSKK